jgi:hypothetical protein
MKQFFLTALLAVSSEEAWAQSIPAGTISLGGSIGYSQYTNKISSKSSSGTTYSSETKGSQFSFSPAAGYFVMDNLAVGLSLGYTATRDGSTTFSPSPGYGLKELDPRTRLQIGPYVQYYKMLTEQFGIVGTLSAGYQNLRYQDYSGNNNQYIIDYKGGGYYAGIAPSIVFFPIPKLGLSASIGSLGYSRYSYDYPTGTNSPAPASYESTSSDFGANFGLSQLQFGGTYYFGR